MLFLISSILCQIKDLSISFYTTLRAPKHKNKKLFIDPLDGADFLVKVYYVLLVVLN